MPAWALTLALAGLLGLLQLLLWAAARGLGRRLRSEAVLAGLLLPFLLLGPWLPSHRLLAPTAVLRGQIPGLPPADERGPHELLNDAVFQFIPWELEVRHALSAGRLPLWSDALGGGSSPWVNPQAGALSPIAMLTRPLPIQHFLLAALAFKVLVAFQGAWLLTRAAGGRRGAALLAGVSFAVGGGIVAWGLFPHSRAAAWVPWVVAGAIQLARRPTPGRMVTTALLTCALLLAGHPETALAGGLLAALCAVALGARGPRRGARASPSPGPDGRRHRRLPGRWGRRRWHGPAAAAGAAALGLGLAAPQVLPFLAVVGDTHRAAEAARRSLPAVEARAGDPGTWFVEGRGAFFLAPLSRHAFGRPYRAPFRGPVSWPDALAAYAGIAVFAGAAAGLALRGTRRRLAPLLGYAAGGLLLASQPLPLMRLLYRWEALRVPAYDRLLPAVALALAVAGALGLEALARGRRRWAGWTAFAAAAAAALALRPAAATAVLWVGLSGAVALRRPGRRRGAAAAGAALLAAVVLADLLPWARAQLPEGHPGHFYPRNATLAAVRAEVAGGVPWQVVGQDYLFYPGLLTVYGLADPRPHDPMAPMDQIRVLAAAFDFAPTLVRYFAPFRHLDHPLLDFLGVRVVIGNRYLPVPSTLEPFDGGAEEPYRLWRNPDALPRWFLASGADAVADRDLPSWIGEMREPRRVALRAAEVGEAPAAGGGGGPVELRELGPGRVVLALPPAAGGGERLLATSLPSPRGWRAADGGGAPLRSLTVNGAFFGALLPDGVRTVELRFTPPGLWAGWGLWALAMAGVAVLLVRARGGRAGGRRPHRAPAPVAEPGGGPGEVAAGGRGRSRDRLG